MCFKYPATTHSIWQGWYKVWLHALCKTGHCNRVGGKRVNAEYITAVQHTTGALPGAYRAGNRHEREIDVWMCHWHRFGTTLERCFSRDSEASIGNLRDMLPKSARYRT